MCDILGILTSSPPLNKLDRFTNKQIFSYIQNDLAYPQNFYIAFRPGMMELVTHKKFEIFEKTLKKKLIILHFLRVTRP
mgnify:CR=1 FL=1